MESDLVLAGSEWRRKAEVLQKEIEQLANELVEAEARLTEALGSLNGFEFQLRAGIGHLIDRLDRLTGEIRQYRQKLRHRDNDADDGPGQWSLHDVEDAYHDPGVDYRDHRYHAAVAEPPPTSLPEEAAHSLKKLYRQLARRFHPDMGINAADRAYRTKMMIAINAAYAAGDLAQLQALALEPDPASLDSETSDEQLVAQLLRELARLQRRLAEVQAEMDGVQEKKHYNLMLQAQQVTAVGRDWLAELKAQLQEQINMKLVERDVLKQELHFRETAVPDVDLDGVQGEAFADAIWDISQDFEFEDDPDLEAEGWASRFQGRKWTHDDDDFLDENA